MFPKDMVFVLVRPSEAGNVGAIARVMRNFGFSDLRLVDPLVDYLEHEDKWMAVGAYDLLRSARTFHTLTEALEDVSLCVGTTSARFRAVKPVEFTQMCGESRQMAAHSKVAWVFGNERNGLTFEELERCHSTTSVSTNSEFPVLNVAQAVALVAYECSRTVQNLEQADTRNTMPTGKAEDQLFQKVDELIRSINFTRDFNHTRVITELRSAYQRMRATNREHALLNGIILRLQGRVQPGAIEEPTTESAAGSGLLEP